jgi:hypothetical protein
VRDREDFFPEDRDFKKKTRAALELCARCPVRAQCLRQAEETPERFGIWGGKTAAERGWDSVGKRLKAVPHVPGPHHREGIAGPPPNAAAAGPNRL